MGNGIDRSGALNRAFEFIFKSEINGSYLEFGVFQGVSLARAIRANQNWKKSTGRNHIQRFIGFDSFEGLPSFIDGDNLRGYEVFQPGQFSDTNQDKVLAELEREGVPTDNVTLISGFYSQSLVSQETVARLHGTPVAIAHIDCDLYSSAKECLNFLTGRLVDGAVMLFDDWFCYRGRPDCGVHKAFDEWRQQAPYWVSKYFNYSWAGRAFIINTKD